MTHQSHLRKIFFTKLYLWNLCWPITLYIMYVFLQVTYHIKNLSILSFHYWTNFLFQYTDSLTKITNSLHFISTNESFLENLTPYTNLVDSNQSSEGSQSNIFILYVFILLFSRLFTLIAYVLFCTLFLYVYAQNFLYIASM